MERREFIKMSLIALGVSLSTTQVSSVWASIQSSSETPSNFFIGSANEAFFRTLVEAILPTGDLTGCNLDLALFVDTAICQVTNKKEQKSLKVYVEKLKHSIEKSSNNKKKQLDQLITNSFRQKNKAEFKAASRLREFSMVGFYTSEYVAKNLFNFNPVPGHYRANVSLASLENRASWSR